MGAHEYVATSEPAALASVNGKFDLILNTTNANLPWDDYVAALSPNGVLHTVGASASLEVAVPPMIAGQKSLAASPVGNIVNSRKMLQFCALHQITPDVETFPMDQINAAFDRVLEAPAHRVVLTR